MNDSEKLPLIDSQLGTELAGGNEDMHKELLTMLKDSLAEHESEVREAFDQQNFDALSKAAHKLHGACCYTGTPRLKIASKNLELAAKAHSEQLADDFNFFIETLKLTDQAIS